MAYIRYDRDLKVLVRDSIAFCSSYDIYSSGKNFATTANVQISL